MYLQGDGLPQNAVHAYVWLFFASESGSVKAKKMATFIEEKMRIDAPSLLLKADSLIKVCRSSNFENCT